MNSNLTKAQKDSGDRVIKFLKSKFTFDLFKTEFRRKKSKFKFLIADNIRSLESQNQEVSFALVKLLRIILIQNGESWIKSNIDVKELLVQVISLYQKGKFSKEIRTKILILLCDIVLNFKLTTVYGYG